MRILFTIDHQDYDEKMKVRECCCVRAVIRKEGKLAVQKGTRGDYKILGGGIDAGETMTEALLREVREEAGLVIKPETIKSLGETIEKHRDLFGKQEVFLRHCYFFACEVAEKQVPCEMTESEMEVGYHLVWETPQNILAANQPFMEESWIYRDTEFVRMLVENKIEIGEE